MTWELRLGDCLDPVSGLCSLPDKSVDHVITDPPYDERTHQRGWQGLRADGGPELAHVDFAPLASVDAYAKQIARLTRRWALVFCSTWAIDDWASACAANGMKRWRVMPWVKPDAAPQFNGIGPAQGWEPMVVLHGDERMRWNASGKRGVYTALVNQDERVHVTQKPVALMAELIADFTDPGDIILDPFAGSGTTGVAAIRLGRRFIGWEKDPKYHAIASRRLAGTKEQLGLSLAPRTKPKQGSLL